MIPITANDLVRMLRNHRGPIRVLAYLSPGIGEYLKVQKSDLLKQLGSYPDDTVMRTVGVDEDGCLYIG